MMILINVLVQDMVLISIHTHIFQLMVTLVMQVVHQSKLLIKNLLVLGEGTNDTIIKVEDKYSVDFRKSRKNLYYEVCTIMEVLVFYMLIQQKYINSKQKTLK